MMANAWDSTTPHVYPTQYGPAHGIGFANSKINFRDITDGSSNTIAIGERAYIYKNANKVGAAYGDRFLRLEQRSGLELRPEGKQHGSRGPHL